MNRIGDLGLLIGIFLIASQTNALDYLSVAQNASKFEFDGVVIMFITLSLFIGAMGKSAQIPLFTWLPDAMAILPSFCVNSRGNHGYGWYLFSSTF